MKLREEIIKLETALQRDSQRLDQRVERKTDEYIRNMAAARDEDAASTRPSPP